MKTKTPKLKWKFLPGRPGIQAGISCSGHYVISHRPNEFNVSFRPPNEHVHVGCGTTLKEACALADKHNQPLPNAPTDWNQVGFDDALAGKKPRSIKRVGYGHHWVRYAYGYSAGEQTRQNRVKHNRQLQEA